MRRRKRSATTAPTDKFVRRLILISREWLVARPHPGPLHEPERDCAESQSQHRPSCCGWSATQPRSGSKQPPSIHRTESWQIQRLEIFPKRKHVHPLPGEKAGVRASVETNFSLRQISPARGDMFVVIPSQQNQSSVRSDICRHAAPDGAWSNATPQLQICRAYGAATCTPPAPSKGRGLKGLEGKTRQPNKP